MLGKISTIFLLICFGVSSTVYTVDAANAVPPWQDLLIHDCSHGLHYLPSSDLSVSFDGSMFNTFANHILAEVKKRAKCGSDAMATRKNIVCNYIPSIEMFMENFIHAYKMEESSAKYNGFPKRNFFNKQNPLFRPFNTEESRLFGGLIGSHWISLTDIWPSSCSVEKFINGEPCFIQFDFEKDFGAKFGFTMQKCPNEKQYAPYFGKFFPVACLHY